MSGALGQLADWPARASAGVLRGGELIGSAGPTAERFAWASVTKLLTAMAALVAVEEGSLSLDDPAGPPGASIRHLLAHASGLPFSGTRPMAPPAKRRIYSNAGFETLARAVEAATAMSFAEYLSSGVLQPLGMRDTYLEGSPAWGASGPLTDLLAFAGELMHPTLISDATLAAATAVAFPGLPGILPGFGRQVPNDWGLGFELRAHKHPHWTGDNNSPATFGHFGRSGSFLWVDPKAGVACASLANREFGKWAAEAWPKLSDAVLAEFA